LTVVGVVSLPPRVDGDVSTNVVEVDDDVTGTLDDVELDASESTVVDVELLAVAAHAPPIESNTNIAADNAIPTRRRAPICFSVAKILVNPSSGLGARGARPPTEVNILRGCLATRSLPQRSQQPQTKTRVDHDNMLKRQATTK
jgi:hypothetical protein